LHPVTVAQTFGRHLGVEHKLAFSVVNPIGPCYLSQGSQAETLMTSPSTTIETMD
jgi:hypothetical protein